MKRTLYLLLTTLLLVLLVGYRSPGLLDETWATLMQNPYYFIPWVGLSSLIGCWIAWRLSHPRHAREYLYLALLSWLFLHILLGLGCGFHIASEGENFWIDLIMGLSMTVVYLFLSFFYFYLSLPICLLSSFLTWGIHRLYRQWRIARKK